jgi:hypothetical protein
MQKIDTLSVQINEPRIIGTYVSTRHVSVNSFYLRFKVNTNSVSVNIEAVTVTPTNVSETSQSIISQQILTQ